MKPKYLISILFTYLIVIVACKEINLNPPPSFNVLLTQHVWKLATWTSLPPYPVKTTTGTVTYSNLLDYNRAYGNKCLTEEELQFNEGTDFDEATLHQYTDLTGRSVCSINQPTEKGYWYIDRNSAITIYLAQAPYALSGNKLNHIYQIQELSQDKLIVTEKNGVYTWIKEFHPN